MEVWELGVRRVSLAEVCWMGVLNITPDSFSDGGRFASVEAALSRAKALVDAGARILDVGAESTSTWNTAALITPQEEQARLAVVLPALRVAFPDVALSLDTRHAETAAYGLAMGVDILNDVSGLRDPAMRALAEASGCGVMAMRSRWAVLPEQDRSLRLVMPPYDDPTPRTADAAVAELAEVSARLSAIDPARVILDPGFGFGTTFLEDLALWEALPTLPARVGVPAARIGLGISRKRFTAWKAGAPQTPPAARDALSAPLHAQALGWGYRVLRAHTVGGT